MPVFDVRDFAREVQKRHPSLRKCFEGDRRPLDKIRHLAQEVGFPEEITENCKVADVCQKIWPHVLEYKP